jgi:spore germination cell wall hydrolase CwlJ-like protein
MKNTIILSFQAIVSKIGIGTLMAFAAFSINIALLSNQTVLAATADSGSTEISEEILWFARTIYSETKKPEEQTLVAWVIRNRVESKYFPSTYKEVVLQYGQFSGMHATDKQFEVNVSMQYEDSSPSWDSALSIARSVYHADPILRPLPGTVTHFFSPISVTRTPAWAANVKPAHEVRDTATNSVRFAFYGDIM